MFVVITVYFCWRHFSLLWTNLAT